MFEPKLLPREIFETILENAVIPTFDLLIEVKGKGFIFLKRKIAPYKDVWALPGLRMHKGQEIDEALKWIASKELNLDIDVKDKVFLGQFTIKFQEEHDRQDLSTGYLIIIDNPKHPILFNKDHFSEIKITYDIPKPIGKLYKDYVILAKKLSK